MCNFPLCRCICQVTGCITCRGSQILTFKATEDTELEEWNRGRADRIPVRPLTFSLLYVFHSHYYDSFDSPHCVFSEQHYADRWMVRKKKWKEKAKLLQRAVMFIRLSALDSPDWVLCIIWSISHVLDRACEPPALLYTSEPPAQTWPSFISDGAFWMTHKVNRHPTKINNRKLMLAWRRCRYQRCPVFFYTRVSVSVLIAGSTVTLCRCDTQFHVILTFHPEILQYLEPFQVTTSQMCLTKSANLL